MKLIGFAGSLQKKSLNKQLVSWACQTVQSGPTQPEILLLSSFDIPLYNYDLEQEHGIPAGVQALHQQLLTADAFLVASPEYNRGISGVFKNTLDWLSRCTPNAFAHKPLLLLTASPGPGGGAAGLTQTHNIFNALQAFVFPVGFVLPQAHLVLSSPEVWQKSDKKSELEGLLKKFVVYANAVHNSR